MYYLAIIFFYKLRATKLSKNIDKLTKNHANSMLLRAQVKYLIVSNFIILLEMCSHFSFA